MDKFQQILPRIKPSLLKKIAGNLYFKYRHATWRERPLPSFLIIGAMRAGTSSLFEYLSHHPQLGASYKKEVHFFNGGPYKKDRFESYGESWYRAFFPRRRELPAEAKTFEASPLYIFEPAAPARISKLIPSVKLIALLRNPTERAISHYFLGLRRRSGRLSMIDRSSLLENFQRDEQELLGQRSSNPQHRDDYMYLSGSLKARGRYHEQLKRYLQFFPMEQILLLPSEQFFNDPRKTLRTVYEFVGVDTHFHVEDVFPINANENKTEMPPSVRKYLDDYFRPHNQALYELTGRDFGWQATR